MAELIRRAVERYLRDERATSLKDALEASSGCWDRSESAEELVKAMRHEWRERELPG